MTTYEVPLTPANQELTIQLETQVYNLRVTWLGSEADPCWILDISDDAGNPILSGVPLVTGVDLLEQFPDLGFEGRLFCGHDGDLTENPLYTDLGDTSHLWWEPK